MIKITKIKQRLAKEKIIILIDGWSSYESLYYLMRKSIPKEYGYIQYAYPDEILNSNPEKTKNNFLHLINTIEADLNKLNSKKPRSFYMYGQSLGTLFCMIVADKIEVRKARLIVPGYNLAESFWKGVSTQDIKKEMIEKHKTTLSQLKNCWAEISPDYYFKNKELNTEFSITLSRCDNVIPVSNGKKLIKFLKKENINMHLSWTELSHKMEIIKEGVFIEEFIKWVSTF